MDAFGKWVRVARSIIFILLSLTPDPSVGVIFIWQEGGKCWKSAVQAELEEWGSHGQGLINEPLI